MDFEVLDTGDIVKGDWRNGMMLDGLRPNLNRNASREAKENREVYKNYFLGSGSVPWQDNFV